MSGINPYQGEWGPVQAMHLLRRIGFGVTRADRDRFVTQGMAKSIEEACRPLPIPRAPVNDYNDQKFTDPKIKPGDTWVNEPFDLDADFPRGMSMIAWWIGLMMERPANVTEKMTLFLHNHMPANAENAAGVSAAYQYIALLRRFALGNFKQFVIEMTKNPCMLEYLNGVYNDVKAPDENYARELQELFTLGRGSGYTESDIKAASRILTGWRYDKDRNSYFDGRAHDFSDKQFSAFYNNRAIKGTGADELDKLVDMIFAKEEVSLYMVRKIYRWFVYHVIDAGIEEQVIAPLAKLFRNSGYELLPVVKTLLSSAHFFDKKVMGVYIKSPLEFSIGLINGVQIKTTGDTPYKTRAALLMINDHCMLTGLQLGIPATVAGWAAYRQVPGYNRFWVNSTTMSRRNLWAQGMLWITQGISDEDKLIHLKIDVIEFVKQFPQPEYAERLINDCIELLFPVGLSQSQKEIAQKHLLSETGNTEYWTKAWNEYSADPANEEKRRLLWHRLKPMMSYLLALPEYQLS